MKFQKSRFEPKNWSFFGPFQFFVELQPSNNMFGKTYGEKTSKKPFFKNLIFVYRAVVDTTARVVRLPCSSAKYCTVKHYTKFRLPCSIKTIPRPEGARYCKIHHEWEKMDITSGDESAQRATSDVHLFSRVMYFCNNEPLRGGVLIIHNFF